MASAAAAEGLLQPAAPNAKRRRKQPFELDANDDNDQDGTLDSNHTDEGDDTDEGDGSDEGGDDGDEGNDIHEGDEIGEGDEIDDGDDDDDDDDHDGDDMGLGSSGSDADSDDKEAAAAAKSASFARAFAKIMGKAVKNDAADVILADSKVLQKRKAEEEAEQASQKAVKKQRMEIKRRGHAAVPVRGSDPSHDAAERVLQRVATKGVVMLFNAVAKAKKAQEARSQGKGAKLAKLDKKSFLAQLRPSAQIQPDSSKQAAAAADKIWGHESAQASGGQPGWKVLRDDFTGLIGGGKKMKDWDKKQDDDDADQSDSARELNEEDSSGDDDDDDGSDGG